MDKDIKNSGSANERETKPKKKKSYMSPLIKAARRVSKLICDISADKELFVSDAGQKTEKRLDTKALKEFSGVIKEMSTVMALIDHESYAADSTDIVIGFDDNVEDMSE